MVDTGVIGQHDVAMRPVTEKTNDTRMSAIEHTYDSPFHALPLRAESFSYNFHGHVIAMHRIFRCVTRNKNVAIDVCNRLIGNHKSVSVLMQHQSPADCPACRTLWLFVFFSWFVLRWFFCFQAEASR